MKKLGVVTELASGPTEQFIKKLQSMSKEQLMRLVTNMYLSPDAQETQFLEEAGVEPEIMQALARQMSRVWAGRIFHIP